MNLEEYTKFCLSSINKRVLCIKSKSFVSSDLSSFDDFEDPNVGSEFLFIGFACSLDEFCVLLKDDSSGDDCISYQEFRETYKFLD